MKPRYIVYGVTQNAEPRPIEFVLAHAETKDEAIAIADEYNVGKHEFYTSIYDREMELYLE